MCIRVCADVKVVTNSVDSEILALSEHPDIDIRGKVHVFTMHILYMYMYTVGGMNIIIMLLFWQGHHPLMFCIHTH